LSYAEKRIAKLRASMSDQGCNLFYVRAVSNIQWLTAFDEVFDTEEAHALIVTEDEVVLHTDSRYMDAALRAASATKIKVNAQARTHASLLFEITGTQSSRRQGPSIIGIESSISLAEYRSLEKEMQQSSLTASLKETQGLVYNLRAVKDEEEIARMRAAQAITDAAYSHIVRFIRPGMTEREVQIELEDFMVRHGAGGLAFSSIVASGANAALPHAIPGQSILEPGQTIVLDFGARLGSYCSDMTRTVFIGEPEQRIRHAYEALREANESVEAFLRPGVTGAQAQELAESILERAGFGGAMGHSLGHGVGLDVHEEPVLAPRNKQALVAGNVITVEPGIYFADEFGMRLEDFGVITENGFEVFTQSSHEMVIL
jgi:Xaa-Pro aminopeptidase